MTHCHLQHVSEAGLLTIRQVTRSRVGWLQRSQALRLKLVSALVLAPVDEAKDSKSANGTTKEDSEDLLAGTVMRGSFSLEGLRSEPVTNAVS